MVIYGTKMISLDDIIGKNFIGRPDAICNHLKGLIKKDSKYVDKLECKAIIDTSRQGNLPIFNLVQPYKFVFSPMDYVGHKIVSSGMIEYIETMKDKIITPKDAREMEKMVNTYNERDMDFQSKYSTNDSIFVNSCFMFVFNDRFVDVYTVKPITLLKEVLLRKQVYTCEKCLKAMEFDNTLHESSVPNLMYQLTDKIEYFCNECSKSIKGLKHVGEQIS